MDTQREGELIDRYINDLLQCFEQSDNLVNILHFWESLSNH
jgi:hypothetical protein